MLTTWTIACIKYYFLLVSFRTFFVISFLENSFVISLLDHSFVIWFQDLFVIWFHENFVIYFQDHFLQYGFRAIFCSIVTALFCNMVSGPISLQPELTHKASEQCHQFLHGSGIWTGNKRKCRFNSHLAETEIKALYKGKKNTRAAIVVCWMAKFLLLI